SQPLSEPSDREDTSMIPEWLRVPSLEEWQRKADHPDFHDARNVGVKDAVQAGWHQSEAGERLRGFPVTAEDVGVDVGCGAGAASLVCAGYGAQVVDCDRDPANDESLAEKVRHTAARAPRGIVTDCTPLPIEDGLASRVI